MKITHLFLTFILFFISTTSLPPCSAAAVLDISGNILIPGDHYYILPLMRGRGGGLTTASRLDNSSCPFGVAQEPFELDRGLPLSFRPQNSKIGFVSASSRLNIRFHVSTTCIQSNIWRVDEYDKSTKQYFIMINGVQGSYTFTIDKYKTYYKIRYCPTACSECEVICKDVGIFIDQDETMRLALSDEPFEVFFMKVEDDQMNLTF